MIWILLPAFNEEQSLPNLLPGIHRACQSIGQNYRVVVVNDGSTDGTENLLKKYAEEIHLTFITHPLNRGLGETERDGFEYIARECRPDDVIIRLDCDDTHEPEYIVGLVGKINQGYDVVNTSRFIPGGGQIGLDVYRSLISYLANIFMKVIFWIPGMRDCSCGFRAYRAQIIKDAVAIFGNGFIQLKGLGFTSTLEIAVKLKLLGCRFAEIPFVLRYDKKMSASKMVSSITTLGYMAMAVLYHWPLGGWRWFFRDLATLYRTSPALAVEKFNRRNLRRSGVAQIGG
ncbi:MAG: dolichol-phosphate mannosyltransferase [Deltaproteobacteria bacterium]|jgi:dolichol-phosphate mannosyltransferase|nr:dolichol-phosphate mannosyltransferase [Deltaproteobacteria bacterium]